MEVLPIPETPSTVTTRGSPWSQPVSPRALCGARRTAAGRGALPVVDEASWRRRPGGTGRRPAPLGRQGDVQYVAPHAQQSGRLGHGDVRAPVGKLHLHRPGLEAPAYLARFQGPLPGRPVDVAAAPAAPYVRKALGGQRARRACGRCGHMAPEEAQPVGDAVLGERVGSLALAIGGLGKLVEVEQYLLGAVMGASGPWERLARGLYIC